MSRARAANEAALNLEALATKLARIVLAQIPRLAAKASEPAVYSTRRKCGPAGVPEREWKKIAKAIGRKPYPGARWLVVERGAYNRWLEAQATGGKPPAQPANDGAEPWSPRAALASVGLRATR